MFCWPTEPPRPPSHLCRLCGCIKTSQSLSCFLGVKVYKKALYVSPCITISLLSNLSPQYLKSLKLMNSKSRSSAACWVEPPPVETGLSVDDRPNELNIAFWVISSVGAVSPLLLHIIYVSMHATSLSFLLYLSFFHFTPPHTNTSLSLSLALCVAYSIFLSHSLFISSLHTVFFFTLHLSSPPFCPLVSLFPHFFSYFFHSLSFTLYLSTASIILSLSSFILFISASLCVLPSLPPSAALCFFFFLSDTLQAFFLSSYLSLWVSLSLPSLSFSLSLSLPFISEPCLWSSIAFC